VTVGAEETMWKRNIEGKEETEECSWNYFLYLKAWWDAARIRLRLATVFLPGSNIYVNNIIRTYGALFISLADARCRSDNKFIQHILYTYFLQF